MQVSERFQDTIKHQISNAYITQQSAIDCPTNVQFAAISFPIKRIPLALIKAPKPGFNFSVRKTTI